LHGILGMALAAAALATPVSLASCRESYNPPARRRESAFSFPSWASVVQSTSPEAWNPNRMSASKPGSCPSSARSSPGGNEHWLAALPRRRPSAKAASMSMSKELGTALSCVCASVLLLASPSSLQPPPARASLPAWAAELTAPASPPAAAEKRAGGGVEQAGGEKKQATSEKAGVDKKPAAIAEPTIKLPPNPITPNKDGEPQQPNNPTTLILGPLGRIRGPDIGFRVQIERVDPPKCPSCPAPWKQQITKNCSWTKTRRMLQVLQTLSPHPKNSAWREDQGA
jgi:hypothetical protein